MTRHLFVALLLAAAITSAGFADTKEITKVVVAMGSGVNADYDASTGALTWSAGASGFLMDDAFNTYSDMNINVSGQFSSASDLSVAGQAKATFTLDFVTLTFNSIQFPSLTGATSSAVLTLSSYNSNKYWEMETAVDSDVLHGQALVGVSAVFDLEPVWGATHQVIWDGDNSVSCLDAMTSLTLGVNYQSYLTSYFSDNNMIILNADETTYTVPEPCTIGLLAFGAAGLFLRRRPLA